MNIVVRIWGNCSKEQRKRLLRLQKRCARVILDSSILENSVMLFAKSGCPLTDNIIRSRKLSLLHKICNGQGPEYFSFYVSYVKDMSRVLSLFQLFISDCWLSKNSLTGTTSLFESTDITTDLIPVLLINCIDRNKKVNMNLLETNGRQLIGKI